MRLCVISEWLSIQLGARVCSQLDPRSPQVALAETHGLEITA